MAVDRAGYAKTMPLAEQGFAALRNVAAPRTAYCYFPVHVTESLVEIEGVVRIESYDLARLFVYCSSCVVMAVTLGPEVDRLIQLLGRGDVSAALACDACASVWADSLCDDFERKLEAELAPGEYLTRRFSPGYGDVPISVTADLLRAVDAQRRIGVFLSQRGMMIPVKSVSALIGISDRPQRRARNCTDCALLHCLFRKNGGVCHDTDV